MPRIKKRQLMVEEGDEGRTAAARFYSLAAACPHRQGHLPLHDLLSKICDTTGNPRCQLVFEHAPDAPPGAHTLVIQPTPAVPQLTSHAPLKHQRIEQFPMKPHLRQWAGRFRP